MAAVYGKLGAVDLAATTDTTVYTVPSSKWATVRARFVNRDTSSKTVRLYVRDAGATLAATHYMEYELVMPPGASYTTDAFTVTATDIVGARASATNITVRVFGIEEDV